MKIPLYRSQATPTSEAPGRSFRARMQSQPYVQAEIEKGNVLGEALNQAASYADMRYKMAREAQLNDALIAADEQLREETDRLSKSNQLYKVLDGDDPIWNKNVEGIRSTLRATVGKDREALRAFDEKFKQAEMSQRFKLRGVLDTKIRQQIALQRKRTLQTAEDASVDALSISEIFLNLDDAKVDGMRKRDVLKANPDALEGQQAALIKNITKRRIQKVLDNADNPITIISALRKAAFEGDQSELAALGVGVVEAELLELIPASDRAAILRAGESLATYIDGPTLEQERLQKQAQATITLLSDSVDTMQDAVDKGYNITDEQVSEAADQFTSLSSSMSSEQIANIGNKINNLNQTKQFSNTLRQNGTPQNIDSIIEQARAGALSGDPDVIDAQDIQRIEYAEKFKAEMVKGLAENPVEFAERVGSVSIPEVNLTPQAAVDGNMGISSRIGSAIKITQTYGKTYVPRETLLKAEEASQLVATIQADPDAGYLMLGQIQKEAGNYSQQIFDQLEDAGLSPELSALMDVTDPTTRQLLSQASKLNDTQTTELFKSLDPRGETLIEKSVDTNLASDLKDFREVYRAGRTIDADIAFGKKVKAAKKVIGLYMSQGVEQSKAEEIALSQLFPDRENTFNHDKGLYFVPNVEADEAKRIDTSLRNIINNKSLFDIMPIADLPMAMRAESRSIINQDALNKKGRLLLNNAGDGVVLHYTLPSGLFLPAYQTNGQLYEIKFKDVAQLELSVMEASISEAKQGYDPNIGFYEMGAEIRKKAQQEKAEK